MLTEKLCFMWKIIENSFKLNVIEYYTASVKDDFNGNI